MALIRHPSGRGLLKGPQGGIANNIRCCECGGDPPDCNDPSATRQGDWTVEISGISGAGCDVSGPGKECYNLNGLFRFFGPPSNDIQHEYTPETVLRVCDLYTWNLSNGYDCEGFADWCWYRLDCGGANDVVYVGRGDKNSSIVLTRCPSNLLDPCDDASFPPTVTIVPEGPPEADDPGPEPESYDEPSVMLMGTQYPPVQQAWETSPRTVPPRTSTPRVVKQSTARQRPAPKPRKAKQRVPDVGLWLRKVLTKTDVKPKRGFGCSCNFRTLNEFNYEWWMREGNREFLVKSLVKQSSLWKQDTDPATVERVANLVVRRARHVDRWRARNTKPQEVKP